MKVAIIDGSTAYRDLFIKLGHSVVVAIEDADLAIFTGGEDVSPSLYGHPVHPSTMYSEFRDQREVEAFNILTSRDIPMVGICRGAQFLNVMSGGTMYQDVTNHTNVHNLIDESTGEVILVTSTHHQMMNPGKNAIIIATAHEKGKRTYWDGHNWKTEQSKEDYEVLMYPETACLCFQPHPEMVQNSEKFEPMRKYFQDLITGYLFE